ncbi:MAG: hypothetical protein HC906_19085 [Bacteroidales bacterium]|nr:hypothetical protein [Bacteroidales bacterium]
MKYGFLILGLISVILTATAMLMKKQWWIRIIDFPRLQIIVLLLISIAGIFTFTDTYQWFVTVVLTLVFTALFIQVSYIFPYFPFTAKDISSYSGRSGKSISLMVANVRKDNRRARDLLRLIYHFRPEVLLTVETNRWWAEALKELNDHYPYCVKVPLENTYGMMLFRNKSFRMQRWSFSLKKIFPR